MPLWSLYSKEERPKSSLITKPWQIFPYQTEVFNCGTYLMHFIPWIISCACFHASTLSTQWDPDLLLDMYSIIFSITPRILHWGLKYLLIEWSIPVLESGQRLKYFFPKSHNLNLFANMFLGGKIQESGILTRGQAVSGRKVELGSVF